MKKRTIPLPRYSLFETRRDDHPAVVVVNSALARFPERDRFPWHLVVSIACGDVLDEGLPTPEESQVLYLIEEKIGRLLEHSDNAVFLARVTCGGRRELAFRVRDAKAAVEALLGQLASAMLRKWRYRMQYDESWELARSELQLLG